MPLYFFIIPVRSRQVPSLFLHVRAKQMSLKTLWETLFTTDEYAS